MKAKYGLHWLAACILAVPTVSMTAQLSFSPPDGGWNYIYEGDQADYAPDGEGFASLDGTWSHDNGSDQWDGSAIGGDFGDGNRPGGAMIITEGSASYLRIQDTGDPRDYGYGDPGSNRKVYLGHDLTADGVADTIMDDGVTLIFRARVPTSGPLDVLHPNGQQANGTQPYPEGGDGYVTSDGGKGNFVIKQSSGGAIAFSLTTATDTPNGNPNDNVTNFSGLSFNEFNGNAISGDVNFGQGDGANVIPFDPTVWHEFWITIKKDEKNNGTHVVKVWMDGSDAFSQFDATAGPGSDFGSSYLAMGATATPQNAALDIDFFGMKVGAVEPTPRSYQDPDGGWDYGYEGDLAAYAEDGEGFASLDGTWSHDNGSDQWDGSAIGGEFGDGNRPGGAMIIEEANVNYLRIQDTGDPRDYGYGDPGSNRKVYLGHDLTADGYSDTIMDDGVTLNFRARVPSDGPLDVLHPNGQQANGTQPYPAGGDGYVTSDGGKGNFVIKQAAGGAIAFSLTTATDTPNGNPNDNVTNFSGLSFNEFNGNAISGDVNFGQGEGANVIPFDPTVWHNFWITVEKDTAEVGTHVVRIYMDGSTAPTTFKATAGPGSDFGSSYLAMGATATPQNAALDIDYFRVKAGVHAPNGATIVNTDILDLKPALGAKSVDPSQGVTFRVTSDGAIPKENISVVLNGLDYSSELSIEGDESAWNVSLLSLSANMVYEGEVLIRSVQGGLTSQLLSFETFSSDSFTFEAEDWNYDRGDYINNPDVGDYFDLGGSVDSEGIDFHELSDDFDFANETAWRFPLVGNMPNTESNGNEADRSRFADDADADYSVTDTEVGEWLNYTRNYTIGDANIWLRGRFNETSFDGTDLGTDTVQLDRVTSDAAVENQTTESLGVFKGSGGGYAWIPLTDSNGNIKKVTLNGEVTLRATILAGDPDLNFFMVTEAVEVPAGPAVLVAEGSATEPGVVDFGSLDGDASYMFYFTAIKAGASTAIAGDNAFAIKLDQWNEQGLFGTTQFGVADNLFSAVDGQSVASVFDTPVHVVIVSDSAAGESHLYINGVLSGHWAGSIPLSGQVKVMGARLEQATDHMGGGSAMHAWATYAGQLTAAEVASLYGSRPEVVQAGAISSVALSGGNVVIEYTGMLKSASSVTGPYSAVAGASSPYSVSPTKAAEFYIAE